MAAPKEQWATRIGVIMAVAGSAVGLGNFLRFPATAAANGGGVFMIPYFAALILLGIPICWAEWTMGRYGGRRGLHSCPAILGSIGRHRAWRYVGVMGLLMPTIVYFYYVVVESWCLAYAGHYLFGSIQLGTDPAARVKASETFFYQLVGADLDGLMLRGGVHPSVWFWVFTFAANFALVYRGISKGIERFCNVAMPIMVFCALIVLVRVLTLPPVTDAAGTRTVLDGLGFMWNPRGAGEQAGALDALRNPKVWLAAAGQIFFTLSVGFGVIMNYASYLKPRQDILLSGLTASGLNEFFEVCLGGLITVTAAFLLFGAAGIGGTFSLAFVTLPVVFETMPLGRFFGFTWFFMLFLAAITSSISLVQPVIAFLEEALGIARRASVTVLAAITAGGSLFVIYFSKGFAALDTLNFWTQEVGILIFGTIEVLLLGWWLGARRGYELALDGTNLRPPRWIFTVLMRFITPGYLLAVFVLWFYWNAPAYIRTLGEGGVPLYSVGVILVTLVIFVLFLVKADQRWGRVREERTAGASQEVQT